MNAAYATRSLFLAFAMIGLIGWLAWSRLQGQAVLPKDAPVAEVSGERAKLELKKLYGDKPTAHPSGTPENIAFRERLIARLKELRLEVTEQPFRDEDRDSVNVIAYYPGEPSANPLVLVTHYDSCDWGPGAGDAGACVGGLLEALRALDLSISKHEFWCVFTDGEERGLRGAQYFVKQKLPWDQRKALIVNLDARGNRGAALMYETQRDNWHSVSALAPALAKPLFTNSLMVFIYNQLPNNTDFTIFKNEGLVGWNFALISGAYDYHTPEDTLDNLSAASAQQFADHAFRAIKQLDVLPVNESEDFYRSSPAVFFDILGWTVISYPASQNYVLSGIAVFVAIACWWRVSKESQFAWLIDSLWILLSVVLCGVLGFGLTYALKASGYLPKRFVPESEWIGLASLLLPLVVMLTVFGTRWRRRSTPSAALSVAFPLLVLSLICTFAAPGAAYLFQWPCWGVLFASLFFRDPNRISAGSIFGNKLGESLYFVTLLAIGVIYVPTILLLNLAMGTDRLDLLCLSTALFLSPFLVVLTFGQESRQVANAK